MRRALFAVLAVLALAAGPAWAAEFKLTGVYRVRGVAYDNADFQSTPAKNISTALTCPTTDSQGNRTCNDRTSVSDTRFRPRLTATDEGGRVVGIFEMDIGNGNLQVAGDAGRRISSSSTTFSASENQERPIVTANRYVIDFLIPGTTLRFRYGKTDYGNPGAWLVFDGAEDSHSLEGYQLYGPLFGAFHLLAWTTQKAEGTANESDDQDAYLLGIEWRPAPQVSIHPWVARLNANVSKAERRGGLPDVETDYYGLTLDAKFGVFSLAFTGVAQRGTIDFKQKSLISGGINETPELKDVDISAYAAQLNAEVKLGPFTVGFQGMMASGDKDPLCGANCRGDISSTIRSQVSRVGHQQGRNSNLDTSWRRFFSGKLDPTSLTPGAAYYIGPQLVTGNRYSSLSAGRSIREPGGDGSFANGMEIYELLLGWQVLPNLKLDANLSLIRSAERRQDILDGSTGETLTKFTDDRDVGTELDLSLKWNLYKSLYARLTGSLLWPGDFGKVTRTGSAEVPTKDQRDDPHWALLSEIRYTF